MKQLAGFLILFYLLVSGFWLANSPYLFSFWGLLIWFISIALGFITYKLIEESTVIKKLVLYTSSFMVFLVLVTGLIHLAVTSMP